MADDVVDDPRKRLSREERRAQLVALGREEVERVSFDGLSTDRVAAAAGISRGLLFHYFPRRDDFLVAIAEDAADELLTILDPDPDLAPVAQLRASLAAYVDHISTNRTTYLALIRGAAGGKPEMLVVFDRTRGALTDRILAALDVAPSDAARLRAVARGYLAFAEEIAVTWLRDGAGLDRDELLELLELSLLGILEATGVDLEPLLAGATDV
ncbi:MAG: TetR/AcrR family transcriptional regulator [Actinobacteria bacterium]|nr:TetR/AcrR family transcriptional regulator [Actinomycetota bacterium]